jgi:hypothetical protein
MMKAKHLSSGLALAAVLAITPVTHGDFSFTQAWGDLLAKVTFAQDGGNLVVTLENISEFDVWNPADVLTAVFFNISGVTLTPVSAALADGSTIVFPLAADLPAAQADGLDINDEFGGEWGYRSDLAAGLIPTGATHVIAAVGLEDLVGPPHLFPGYDLDQPDSPDGINYGILSKGDVTSTGTPNVTGTEPLIWYGAVFTLSGLPESFDLENNISAIAFNYGTDLNVIPAPPAALLGVLGLALVGWVTRRAS